MDYQKQIAVALENANEINGKLVKVIDKNNKVTSGHNKLMIWLTILIVLLTIFTLLSNYNNIGRYVISSQERGIVYVLDTKTSQLWIRSTGANRDLGTNENPMYETIKRRVESFEEIPIKADTNENNK